MEKKKAVGRGGGGERCQRTCCVGVEGRGRGGASLVVQLPWELGGQPAGPYIAL